MKFDDYWDADQKNDRIMQSKDWEGKFGISGSEKSMLDIWRSHFNGYSPGVEPITMFKFDSGNQAKVLYLLSVFRYFSIQ